VSLDYEEDIMISDGAGKVSNSISYEPPFHGSCAEEDVMLFKENSSVTWLSLSDIGLDQIPDVIVIGGLRYRYGGVADGRGIYQQIEE